MVACKESVARRRGRNLLQMLIVHIHPVPEENALGSSPGSVPEPHRFPGGAEVPLQHSHQGRAVRLGGLSTSGFLRRRPQHPIRLRQAR